MEAEAQDADSVREIYERAIANTPPTQVWPYMYIHEQLQRTCGCLIRGILS